MILNLYPASHLCSKHPVGHLPGPRAQPAKLTATRVGEELGREGGREGGEGERRIKVGREEEREDE